MSFSEQIEEDDELLHVYEKMIFNTFHKRIKQLKQVNTVIKGTCIEVQDY